MAGKLVELNEAAKAIGVTPDELTEMRSRGEIFGVRTEGTWKFKQEEVERVVNDRAGGGSAIAGADNLDFGDLNQNFTINAGSGINLADDEESILITDEGVGGPDKKKHSTIIGKGQSLDSLESDIRLAPEPGDPADLHSGSDLKLGGSGTNPLIASKDSGSDLSLDGSALTLSEDDDGEITLGSDATTSGAGSAIGSDITLGASDSGINLAPADSGLSLEEEPLELGGSAVDSLELPEDEDVISLSDESADPDQATQLKADDQFMLTGGDALVDDESDSGSQVIALEDSEAFDQDAATMLGGGQALLSEDAFGAMPNDPLGGGMMGGVSTMAMPGMPSAMPQQVVVQVPVVEAPYSIFNVLSLLGVALVLALCGMLMVDVMLNMWQFDQPGSLSTAVMDTVVNTLGMSNK